MTERHSADVDRTLRARDGRQIGFASFGDPEGVPQVAIDSLGAGLHERVLISSDGAAARKAVGDERSPVRWIVVGVVDEVSPGTTALEDAAA